jgi:hypothetical protein
MASPLRPQFFCSRPNGNLTPLIALDELPANVSVRGVFRYLAPQDTVGMTSLGTVEHRSQLYIVDGIQVAPIGSPAIPVIIPNAQEYDLSSALSRIAGESSSIDPRTGFQSGVPHNSEANWSMTGHPSGSRQNSPGSNGNRRVSIPYIPTEERA